jgi:REP element-mobilizing transposase RayT
MTERPSSVSTPRTEVRGMARGDAPRLYHIWFSPKRRTHALQGDIRSSVFQSLDRIATEHNILIIEAESLPDHIHLLLRLPEALTLPKAVRYLKGASARRILQLMPELKSDLQSNHFWQRGYGARPVEPGAMPTIRRYIRQHRPNIAEPRTSVRGELTP